MKIADKHGGRLCYGMDRGEWAAVPKQWHGAGMLAP
jgi:hypothetical protein